MLIPRTHNDNRTGSISRGSTPSTLVPLAYRCHPVARSTNGGRSTSTDANAFRRATAPLVANRTSTGNTPLNSSIRRSAWFPRMTRRLSASLDIRCAYVTRHAQRYYGECLLGRLRRTMESQSLYCSLQRAKSLGAATIESAIFIPKMDCILARDQRENVVAQRNCLQTYLILHFR
ncbi:hypothetical protein HN011_004286 [Eciton burchellii]|nr:hypothetical protein HN011_004286 [Eciton burchellii]